MCGRYVSPETAAIEREFKVARVNSNPFPRRFNVAPTMVVPILRKRRDTGEVELTDARWGFIPSWWNKPKPPGHGFNARAEEAAVKPMWRDAFAGSRCLIPAVGWYEWRLAERADSETGEFTPYRQPHFIYRPDANLVCFGGLLSYRKEVSGDGYLTCAIVTRDAATSVRDIHDRMPVAVRERDFSEWLDRTLATPDRISEIIAGAQTDFAHHPVTTRLNAAKTDEPEFVHPL